MESFQRRSDGIDGYRKDQKHSAQGARKLYDHNASVIL
jgi:hypothetical protein